MPKIILKKFHAVIESGNRSLREFHRMAAEINKEYREKAQLVRVTSSKGWPRDGFFNRMEVVFADNKLRVRVVVNQIIETENMIIASNHEDHVYDALTIEPYTHRRFRHRVL